MDCYEANTSCRRYHKARATPIVVAFQVTGDMAPKTGDSLLRKHQQSGEKEDRIVTARVHFLSTE